MQKRDKKAPINPHNCQIIDICVILMRKLILPPSPPLFGVSPPLFAEIDENIAQNTPLFAPYMSKSMIIAQNTLMRGASPLFAKLIPKCT